MFKTHVKIDDWSLWRNMKEVNLNMTTKIYALVAGDDEEEIMFAVSTDTDTLKDMLEQNVGEYRIKEIGLWDHRLPIERKAEA